MAARVGNHPSQLAVTNNIKKLDFNTDRERTGKSTKQSARAYAKATMSHILYLSKTN